MTTGQRRFVLFAGLAFILLSVAGVAFMLDLCAPLTGFDDHAPLGFFLPPLLEHKPEALADYAAGRVERRLGTRGSIAYGPTQALYHCDEAGCVLARYDIAIALEPVCWLNYEPNRRTQVSYTFDFRQNLLVVETVDPPWNGELDLAAFPISFTRAAELMHANIDPVVTVDYPAYAIHLMPLADSWSVQVMSQSPDDNVLHLYAVTSAGSVLKIA